MAPRKSRQSAVEFPEHGDVYEDDHTDPPAPESEIEPEIDPEPEPRPDPLAELNAKLDRQQKELDELRRRQPPPEPKTPTPPRAEEDDFNWDEELFRNPRKTLEKHGKMVAEQVTKHLTSQYQRDRGTQKFWDDFYAKHPDLKQDHDLVEVTLNSNLSKMASMPVEDAMDRLAELTRDRILRYAGGVKSGRKARAEGGKGSIAPTPTKQVDTPKVLSITEILKNRRADRRKKAAGV